MSDEPPIHPATDLATDLARALMEGRTERWDLPGVSRETLECLGQLLGPEPHPTALRSLEALLEGDNLRAAVLAFAYWVYVLRQGLPVPAPKRVKLAGANLEGWQLRGRGPEQPLDLRGADLSGVRLDRARLEYVDLADAHLTALTARQALFLNVNAPRARAQGVDFRGLRWREGSLSGAELRGARLDGCQWIRVGLTGARLPDEWERHATTVETDRPPPALPPRLMSVLGHASVVWAARGVRTASSCCPAPTTTPSRSGTPLPETAC